MIYFLKTHEHSKYIMENNIFSMYCTERFIFRLPGLLSEATPSCRDIQYNYFLLSISIEQWSNGSMKQWKVRKADKIIHKIYSKPNQYFNQNVTNGSRSTRSCETL